MISSTQNEEMSSGNDEKETELDAEAKQEAPEASLIFAIHCKNFARIAKISQGLRKFRNHSENFTILAKISQSLRKFRYAHFFAKLAKFPYHSENSLP